MPYSDPDGTRDSVYRAKKADKKRLIQKIKDGVLTVAMTALLFVLIWLHFNY